MKILWIVNKIFPYPSKKLGLNENVFGGWLQALADNLIREENINLTIATVYKGNKLLSLNDGKIEYYLIPGFPATKYNKIYEEYWKIIKNKIKPDIVHIHGTEYAHGLAFLKACPEVRSVVSIQGLISICANVYYGNINMSGIIKNITIRDILKHDSIIQQKQKFEKRGKYEIETIKRANAVIGRTTWDFANVKTINPNIKYYVGNETLRAEFYKNKWDIKNIERDTIFCSQAGYPIKGFHYLLKTLYFLKNIKPQIKLYVGGPNITDTKSLKSRIKRSGYGKYISKLIKEYGIQDNIIFLGLLNEQEVIKRLLKTNVFVLPSAIENSSNSLAEAMILGIPCVASNTGGTTDMLENKKEGFIYPYTEPGMCAQYILKFLNDDNLCAQYGENARNTALVRHNPKENVKQILSIYKDR